jgi:hypothetical protein
VRYEDRTPWTVAGVPLCFPWQRLILDGGDSSRCTRLYVVRDKESGAVKIGVSQNARKRASELQVASPRPLALVVDVPAPKGFEKFLHALLAADRLKGEWFNPSPRVLEAVAELEALARAVAELEALARVLADHARMLRELEEYEGNNRATIDLDHEDALAFLLGPWEPWPDTPEDVREALKWATAAPVEAWLEVAA